MCPEPQCLVPIIVTKAEQVVLIGDHKQLQPIIMCREAAELGLEKSMFERHALCQSRDSNRNPVSHAARQCSDKHRIAQRHELREALKKQSFVNFNVNTVVASQGGEWDYVLFSIVRSLPEYMIERNPTLGWCKMNLCFIIDHHQINVALTRARKGLIIV
ncbi:hypothetical protein CHS0354_036698, partial [Potamilus streckersoni]